MVKTGMCCVGFAVLVLSTVALTAAEPTELARGEAPRHPQQPQLAVDTAGAIHVV